MVCLFYPIKICLNLRKTSVTWVLYFLLLLNMFSWNSLWCNQESQTPPWHAAHNLCNHGASQQWNSKKLVAKNTKFNSSFLKISNLEKYSLHLKLELLYHTKMTLHREREKRNRPAASPNPNGPFLNITSSQKHCFQKCQFSSTEMNREPQLTSLHLWGGVIMAKAREPRKRCITCINDVCASSTCLMPSRGQRCSKPLGLEWQMVVNH